MADPSPAAADLNLPPTEAAQAEAAKGDDQSFLKMRDTVKKALDTHSAGMLGILDKALGGAK